MNDEMFERLLYEEEGPVLDFKREQYRFVKANEEEKSELLKDILGFANAWRRSIAYILIGVEEVRGGRSNVAGIATTDHFDDHSLQQFVNNLTNQPVQFQYEAFGFKGKQVGIISIMEQNRPIYLKRDYGKLAKEKVYVRRGSSTDPTKPALPDEIAKMGADTHEPAELLVEFADTKLDSGLGTSVRLDTEICQMPAKEQIPDYVEMRETHALSTAWVGPGFNFMNHLNEDYLRELAQYEFWRRLFRPVRLVVKNVGQVAANNVRVELMLPRSSAMIVVDEFEIPNPPKRRHSLLIPSALENIRSAIRQEPGDVIIDQNDERFRIEIGCGHLQPGRRVWSDIFYLGKGKSGDLQIHSLIFADNLPQPKSFVLTVSGIVTKTSMTVEDIVLLSQRSAEK